MEQNAQGTIVTTTTATVVIVAVVAVVVVFIVFVVALVDLVALTAPTAVEGNGGTYRSDEEEKIPRRRGRQVLSPPLYRPQRCSHRTPRDKGEGG